MVTEELTKGYIAVLRFLAHKPRTEYEVARKLENYYTRRGVSDSHLYIPLVLDMLREEKFVNDQAYVDMFVTSQTENKKKSTLMLKKFLISKGISEELILDRLNNEDEYERAAIEKWAFKKLQILKSKKIPHNMVRHKLITYLIGKGFNSEKVFDVVDTMLSLK